LRTSKSLVSLGLVPQWDPTLEHTPRPLNGLYSRAYFSTLMALLGSKVLSLLLARLFLSLQHTHRRNVKSSVHFYPLCSNLFKGLTQLSPETQQMRLLSTGTCKVSHSNRQCSSQLIFCSIGKEIGVDPNVILQTSHGRRSIDVLKILSPEKANWECQSILINR
jgi:hypothetical protein